MKWRVAIGVLAMSAIALAGLGWLWASAAGARGKTLRLPGVVEIQEVRLASKQGGRIKELRVGEGQWVEKDQVLMEFETPELAARLEQLKAQRDSIQVELDKANKGSRLEEINVAAAAAKAAEEKLKRVDAGLAPRGDPAGQDRLPGRRGRRQAGQGRAGSGRGPLPQADDLAVRARPVQGHL